MTSNDLDSVVGYWTRRRPTNDGGLFKELELRSDGSFRYSGRFVEDNAVVSNIVVEGTWRFDALRGELHETTTLWNGATANENCVLSVTVANGATLNLANGFGSDSPIAGEWMRRTS